MIITWFTDPSKGTFTEGSGKFSSYYQYDTTTRKFVRIRLELGRKSSSNGDSGRTGAFFKEKRYVGFSNDPNIRTSEKSKWSINENGQLEFNGKALETKPAEGLGVFDTSSSTFNEDTFIHRGNAVTNSPNLPEGIEIKHLNLIANDAIINRTGTEFTGSKATGEELSASIKGQVEDIIGKSFDEITNDDILEMLKAQVKQIKEESVEPAKESVEESLDEVNTLIEDINESIAEKGMVPTEEFEAAFKDLQTKISEAKSAVESGNGIKKAISDLAEAKTVLDTAAKDINQDHYEELKDSFTSSEKAIESAQAESQKWEDIASEYQKAEEATSIEEYEESIEGIKEAEFK